MKSVLITIVSEQTIPNVLFIKEMQKKAEHFLFVTTETMEARRKTDAIITACHISKKKTNRLLLSETKPSEMAKELREWIDFQYADNLFLVNLTGGTKMMSLAIYSLFKQYNSEYYYLPIGKNKIIRVLDNFEEVEMPLLCRLSLHEYLKANGLQYSVKTGLVYTQEQCLQLFEAWQKHDFLSTAFPLNLAIKLTGLDLHWENAPGEWFEEFIYYEARDKFHLTVSQIGSSVMIYTDAESPFHDNEFDVMWVHQNELFVAECKVTLGNKPRTKLDQVIYKLGAINKSYGLKTNSFIYTLAQIRKTNGEFSSELERRLKILNINDLIDKTHFTVLKNKGL